MGVNILFNKSCYTSSASAVPSNAIAPNPDQSRWELLGYEQFKNAYVLRVKYFDCTNFEGEKVMVYRGQYVRKSLLDPHFSKDSDSPIARFKPDDEGQNMAIDLAQNYE